MGVYVPDSSEPDGFRVLEEYVHLDGWRPVAVVRPDLTHGMNVPRIHPILTDHLGTPRKVLDGGSGEVRWDWDAKDPFGHQAPNETPTPGLVPFAFELRFPGQRHDPALGLYHNGFRDYHPGLGRYVQSDPLGLEAGWNTYIYVGGAPTLNVDWFGLEIVIEADKHGTLETIKALNFLEGSRSARAIINHLSKSEHRYVIRSDSKFLISSFYNIPNRIVFWDYSDSALCLSSMKITRPEILLLHELYHAYEHDTGSLGTSVRAAEERALIMERAVGGELGIYNTRINRALSVPWWRGR